MLLSFLDLSAAFDTVDHDILLQRLETAFDIRGPVLSWIRSFLESHTQSVSFADQSSSTSPIPCGVPQGSVLSPILFLLYAADVTCIAERHNVDAHSYTDDTQLYCHGKVSSFTMMSTRLTLCIREINEWMSSNRL